MHPNAASRFVAAAGEHLGRGLDEAEDPRGYRPFEILR
jgi:hypothetical protein